MKEPISSNMRTGYPPHSIPTNFKRIDGLWYYEDKTFRVANVRGRGLTRGDAFRHWQALTRPRVVYTGPHE